MPTDECNFCGKTENLVEFEEEMYCKDYCLGEAEKNAAINEADKVKEDMRLWK